MEEDIITTAFAVLLCTFFYIFLAYELVKLVALGTLYFVVFVCYHIVEFIFWEEHPF